MPKAKPIIYYIQYPFNTTTESRSVYNLATSWFSHSLFLSFCNALNFNVGHKVMQNCWNIQTVANKKLKTKVIHSQICNLVGNSLFRFSSLRLLCICSLEFFFHSFNFKFMLWQIFYLITKKRAFFFSFVSVSICILSKTTSHGPMTNWDGIQQVWITHIHTKTELWNQCVFESLHILKCG